MKRIVALCLAICLVACILPGCKNAGKTQGAASQNIDKIDMSAMNNTTALLAGTDALGREVNLVTGDDSAKEVGIFYFLWHYMGGESLYDVSQVLANDPNAAQDSISWLKAGGGLVGTVHWWGESLFGHYFANDEWVIERDVMMLTDAGIDFLVMDYSNLTAFDEQLLILLKALDKYYQQGFEVPKITAITKNESGTQIMGLYENIYLAHPEYGHLWYRMDSKPMIIGNPTSLDLSEDCLEYFTIMYAQWPRETYHTNGFPWMDFGWWTEDGSPAVFGTEDGRTIMSVSVAQHSGTLALSSSAFYGDTTNHTRNWHDGANDTAEDAYLYGYNFAEQFECAIEKNPDIIFITGWNEWIAGRQTSWNGIHGEITDPVILVDCADINNSRDIQPMKGGYGDNYYMQMVEYIRQYKGSSVTNVALNTAVKVEPITIDIQASTEQWNSVGGYYLDYIYDTEDRRAVGYGGILYTDETGRNDIYKMKVANDSQNLYAYVQTMGTIQGTKDGHCLSMFISTGIEGNATWCGYDYVIGRTQMGIIEKRTANGWEKVGTAAYSIVNNELQFAVPLSTLGLSSAEVSIQFKFADNYQGEDDIYSFYLNGDAAPYGRLNYVYKSSGIHNVPEFEANKTPAEPDGVVGWVKGQ